MAELQATLTAAAELQATLGAGKINVNDYTLSIEEAENGVNLTLTRGSRTETVFIPDYSEAENEREKSEDERMESEDTRTSAELLRIGAEEKRIAAETERIKAETERAEAESERKTSEAERISSETARSEAESARASAEEKREANCDAAVQSANSAAANAQSIADTVQAKLDAGEFKGEKGEKGEKGDTGAQGEKGDKGDTGADGYSPTATVSKSGTTTTISVTDRDGTTTAEVKDGSDASVTKENVVAALGYEPQPQEGQYELINSITITEEVTSLTISTDKDNNPFDLVHGYVKTICSTSVTTSKSGSIYWYGSSDNGNLSLSGYYQLFAGTTGNVYYWVHRYGSRVECLYERFNATNSITEAHNVMVKGYTNPHITHAYLYVSAKIPVGCTIELYGIRA